MKEKIVVEQVGIMVGGPSWRLMANGRNEGCGGSGNVGW